tara:strand:+ start:49 stop:558 length:510 start_codon:yes stop_codon:yes gene_type:complete
MSSKPEAPPSDLAVVLFQPEIPPNTGNVARTCAATGIPLHLVRPLGFSLSDRYLKRAGLDYWDSLDLTVHDDWDAFCRSRSSTWRPALLTTSGTISYTEIPVFSGTAGATTHLVFGPETRGLPQDILAAWPDAKYRVPMRPGQRSLNLGNTVALVLYDQLAQRGFPGLE